VAKCCGVVGICCGVVAKCCGVVGICCGVVAKCCGVVGICCGVVAKCCGVVGICCGVVAKCCGVVGIMLWQNVAMLWLKCCGVVAEKRTIRKLSCLHTACLLVLSLYANLFNLLNFLIVSSSIVYLSLD
jgi:hypothetical protein